MVIEPTTTTATSFSNFFEINFTDWEDFDQPLAYQIWAYRNNSQLDDGSYINAIPLTEISRNNHFSIQLPTYLGSSYNGPIIV